MLGSQNEGIKEVAKNVGGDGNGGSPVRLHTKSHAKVILNDNAVGGDAGGDEGADNQGNNGGDNGGENGDE